MSEREEESYSRHEQHSRTACHNLLMTKHPQQSRLIIFLQPHRNKRLLRQTVTALASAEQIAAQHWRERQGDDCRREQRHDEGYSQRYEHLALHTAEEEQRHETHHYYDGGIENRHAHLARGVEHHVKYRAAFLRRKHAVLAQMLPHILHIHYGVVHKRAYGNRHSAEAHGVDAQPHIMKD